MLDNSDKVWGYFCGLLLIFYIFFDINLVSNGKGHTFLLPLSGFSSQVFSFSMFGELSKKIVFWFDLKTLFNVGFMPSHR